MTNSLEFFATCPKNLEDLLEQELLQIGAGKTKKTVAGVNFSGDLMLAYRVCLWSRLANRVLLPLAKVSAYNAQTLYNGIKQKINWLEHFTPEQSFVVDFAGYSPAFNNTQFGAQKIKDAIVDQMRDKTGKRPNIVKENPDIRINAYLSRDIVTISLDLSGESLHRRSYRQQAGIAPLKENLAAAMLIRANWPTLAAANKPLIDPLCGSGTLLIEAALIAADIAPGLLRQNIGVLNWLQHDEKIWQTLLAEAEERRTQGLKKLPGIYGFDADENIIALAQENIARAQLTDYIHIQKTELKNLHKPAELTQAGIIVTNPPYGERLSNEEELIPLYQELGEKLKTEFSDWQAAVLTSNPELGKKIKLQAYKKYALFNGPISCKLLLLDMSKQNFSH